MYFNDISIQIDSLIPFQPIPQAEILKKKSANIIYKLLNDYNILYILSIL